MIIESSVKKTQSRTTHQEMTNLIFIIYRVSIQGDARDGLFYRLVVSLVKPRMSIGLRKHSAA